MEVTFVDMKGRLINFGTILIGFGDCFDHNLGVMGTQFGQPGDTLGDHFEILEAK